MEQYFENEIKKLENELTALKTSMTKTSGSIATISKSVNFTINLASTGGSRPSGRANFIIHVSNNALFQATLDKYYDDVMVELQGRYLTRFKYIVVAERFGNTRVDVRALGTKNDETTIAGGGTVSVSGVLTIKCTNDFTLEPL